MSKTKNVTVEDATAEAPPAGGYAPEADFDDNIAHNRVLPVPDPETVPKPDKGYRPTDPATRSRRLRRIAGEHRAEGILALTQIAKRDTKTDLGTHAPDGKRAKALLDRMNRTGDLVTAALTLLAYAKEQDQIALSDALVYMEAVNKELNHTLEHVPTMAANYGALMSFFAGRSDAIIEGMTRAKDEAQAAAKAADAAKPAGK
jgi:hypothetical protein